MQYWFPSNQHGSVQSIFLFTGHGDGEMGSSQQNQTLAKTSVFHRGTQVSECIPAARYLQRPARLRGSIDIEKNPNKLPNKCEESVQ